MRRIYLDHNSTTPIAPSVAKAIFDCHESGYVNPASQHQSGQLARRELESIRLEILKWLDAHTTGMDADRLVFTSGGTESNNLALLGLAGQEPGQVLVSSIEHPSVFGPAEVLARQGFEVISIPVSHSGVIDLVEAEKRITTETRLVSLMLANNETGVIQPVAEIAKLCRELGVRIHCDATQAITKIPVSFRKLEIDAMTFSPHKFYGPRGIGGLVLKSSITPNPILFGGFQQMGIRPGTEDLGLAVGTLTALQLCEPCDDTKTNVYKAYKRVADLRNRLQTGLEALGAVTNGSDSPRLPNTLNISFPGVNRQAFLMAADMVGLDLSTGSACASGSSEPSPVLVAMGLPDEVIEGSVRISLGLSNTAEEIDEAIARIERIVQKRTTSDKEPRN